MASLDAITLARESEVEELVTVPVMACTTATSLAHVLDSRLKPKLDAIELVRSDLTVERIEVPGVVVIGDQSAGKSSVLESISGINFPRGENTCTRRPCILRMESDVHLTEPYAVVSNDADLKGCSKISLKDIGGEIQRLTREAAGPGSSIIAEPIHVKVVQTSGPTLTLIDLPGITWVNEAQKDIHDIIVSMIIEYIKNPQMVILAVVSATSDFGNSEALKLAKEVDPSQTRTIGVVTKIDTIQKDSDIVLKIRAERPSDIKLALGWVAVRCRTPTEVKEALSAEELMTRERTFFKTNDLLADLQPHFWGTPTLVEKVVEIQSQTIEKWLPKVRTKINEVLRDRTQRLRTTPETCNDDSSKRMVYAKLVDKLVDNLTCSLRGDYGAYLHEKEMHIPPRMYAFFSAFMQTIEKDTTDFLSPEITEIIEELDSETRGVVLPNFLSDPVFRTLFVAEFEKVVPKAVERLLHDVRDYMLKVLTRFVRESMADYPRLVSNVELDLLRLVQERHEAAEKFVDALLESESSCILTMDEVTYGKLVNAITDIVGKDDAPEDMLFWFVDLFGTGSTKANKIQSIRNVMTARPRIFNMQISLAAYSTLVHRQIVDRVTKNCKLLFEVKLPKHLREFLLNKGEMDFIRDVMQQDPKLVHERKHLDSSIERLKSCLATLAML